MTVSVIIPTHNYARFLGQAIDSIQRGAHADWQCIVVDDGSTDGTAEIAAALTAADKRISYLSQESAGPSAARNAGLAVAAGDFVQFLDADDLLGSHKLQHQLEVFGRHPEADIVYGGVRYFVDDGTIDDQRAAMSKWVEGSKPSAVTGAGEIALAALVDDNFMVVEAPLIRRTLLTKVGGFDPRIRRMEDWELWLRCAMAGAYFVHDGSDDETAMPHVRVHRSSISQDQISMHETAAQVRGSIDGTLPTADLRRLNRRRIHEHWAVIGMLEGMNGRLGLGMGRLLRAGFAERRGKWLAWGVLMPATRIPIAKRAMGKIRTTLAQRRGEEVRDWQAHWP
ncbi:MAG TPA: glycosyltransferase [Candidatus Limnocylindrales bacterium]